MSIVKTFATAGRVIKQLKHDPRTLVLLFLLPSLLIVILRYVFDNQKPMFDLLVPMLLGIFPMTMMFLVASIATLRERRSGTLTRLMTTPMSKLDFIMGYALAFFLIAFLQASFTVYVTLGLLDVTVAGGDIAVVIGAVSAALLGTSLGLAVSAFATSEFQAVQFMPAMLFPQLLVCGLFVARDQMADFLQVFADFMPLTYSVDAMKQVTQYSEWTAEYTNDLLIVTGFTIAALILGSLTIRRKVRG
jgi:ABC-2 type transport system permease protein